MITVFYDGKCGLCSKEIAHYRKIAPDGVFDWQDITASSDALEREGVSLAEGLERLHVKDSQGVLHVGVAAFIAIWKPLRRWRLLAWIVALPVIRPVADRVYNRFAAWRFKRLAHCQIASASHAQTQP